MKKSYVRRLDKMGRIIIPLKFYQRLKFEEEQEVEITIEYGKICIKKYEQQDMKQLPYVGVVRKLDNMHRVVIPKEYMRVCELKGEIKLELALSGEKIEISID